MSTKEQKQETPEPEIREKFRIKSLFQGRFISNDFLIRQWKNILLIVFLILVYISNRYTCQQKIAEIGSLQKQLTDIRYEALTLSSELMGSSRQSQVKKLIETKGIPLEEAKQPPYKLMKKSEK
ncbi:FtsL-like putative cell division protein [Coprobacter tertius]|uniref:FtsL-like putative cell division protein n=1 Tax=Coprobacter tertius TaxID=2944915 RepID=A0ABT1MFW0_9BACT|nr:FtsL-like putative cell division protein [Coprobacter tertius]MCP9610751.1 FtsL-like putative cell division protein [Coprobacter tertius]